MIVKPPAAVNINPSTTDGSIVAAVPGRRMRIFSFELNAGATATPFTFNSKGSGAGTAISGTINCPVNTPVIFPHNPNGWFDTNVGEGLTGTTGAGSVVTGQVDYGLLF